MIARAASAPASGVQPVAQRAELGHDALGWQRLADHAGRGDEHMARGTPSVAAAASTVARTASRPAPPVKALELPEFTRIAKPPADAVSDRSSCEFLLAPQHRRPSASPTG